MTDAAATIHALNHTGADNSPLGESAEYVLSLLMPAISALADRSVTREEFITAISSSVSNKADLADVSAVEARLEQNERRLQDMLVASARLAQLDAQVAELVTAMNIVDMSQIHSIIAGVNLLEAKLSALKAATQAVATAVDADVGIAFAAATNG